MDWPGLTGSASIAAPLTMAGIAIIMPLAAGHLDIVMEHQLATHDFMALILFCKGPGRL